MNEITQEDIQKAYDNFGVFDKTDPAVIPTPTRYFELEETVRLGGLKDIQVKEILHDGKAYRLEYTRVGKDSRTREKVSTRQTGIWWWQEIEKMDCADLDADDIFVPYLPGQVTTTPIDSLLHQMSNHGLVCDPRYQRGYVWTLENQQELIDSIFNRINLGSFIFSRHAGYHHDGSDETVKYINLDGEEIEILRRNDYTLAVIDGQQRITTIWRYYTNQFQYRGRYWKDLSFRDQNDFTNTLISQRIFEEEDVPYEEVLRMFIKVNKGVPQDASHLDKVTEELKRIQK